jgi:hypothetical protein
MDRETAPNHLLPNAPAGPAVIVSQAWRAADPTAYNRDINDGQDLDAVPQPSEADNRHVVVPANITVA